MMAALSSGAVVSATSILDIKYSITDDNVVPPESFETKTRELEENFYLQNYVVQDTKPRGEKLGTAKEYEERLAQLPTEIEMPYNSIVGKFINMYLGKKRGLVSNMLALHSYYGNIFVEELLKEGVPVELQYLPVIESAINPNAVSRAGAGGLWQFMPGTAKGLGMEINSLVDERRDPRSSSRNAAKYLKQLYNIYNDWSLAIAAYNCGPGNVNKAIRRAGGGQENKDFWTIYNYLPKETRGYVPAFIAANYVMNYYDKHNISPTVVKRALTTDTVHVGERIHFQQIADVLNIPIEEIRMLNPQYRKDIIPGGKRPYVLTLPKQQVLSFVMSEDQIRAHNAEQYAQRTTVQPGDKPSDGQPAPAEPTAEPGGEQASVDGQPDPAAPVQEQLVRKTHVVRKGENIRDIAKLYGVSATDIKRWNHLRRGKVKEGDELVIETYERVQPEGPVRRDVAASDVPPAPAKKTQTTAPVPAPPKKSSAPAASSAPVPAKKEAKRTTAQNPPKEKTSRGRTTTAKQEPKKKDNKKKDAKKKTQKPQTHTVREGESLDRIARQYGVSVDEIRRANGMKKDETMIRPNQKVKVPAKKAQPQSKKSDAKKKDNKKDNKKKDTKKSNSKKKSKKR